MRILRQRYELIEPIGQGGMGQVWRGRDLELARIVGIKTLPGELSRQPEFRERFQREARAVAALTHPGITVLHDYGRDDDPADPVPFLVMEYVDGCSLSEHIRSGPIPVGRAAAIARDVADALAHSHSLGIVHRDIKPSNVMLTQSGAVKVLDFGIARMLADTATRLTTTGRIVGTPAYMAPEQAEGKPTDARADQYSLGCLLFELLSGKTPFTGDSVFSVMNQHLTRPASPPSERRAEVPVALDAVVLRLLAKSSEDRFAEMEQVRAALAEFADGPDAAAARRDPSPPASATPAPPTYAPNTGTATATATAQQPTPVAGIDTPPRPHVPPRPSVAASATRTAPAAPPPVPPAAPPSTAPPKAAPPPTPPPRTLPPTYVNPRLGEHRGRDSGPSHFAANERASHGYSPAAPTPTPIPRPPAAGRAPAIAATAAAALVAVMALTPWGSVSGGGESMTYDGFEGYVGQAALAAGLLAALLFGLGSRSFAATRAGVASAALAAALALMTAVKPAVFIWTTSDARDESVSISRINKFNPSAEVGAYVALLAAVIACAAGVMVVRHLNASTRDG